MTSRNRYHTKRIPHHTEADLTVSYSNGYIPSTVDKRLTALGERKRLGGRGRRYSGGFSCAAGKKEKEKLLQLLCYRHIIYLIRYKRGPQAASICLTNIYKHKYIVPSSCTLLTDDYGRLVSMTRKCLRIPLWPATATGVFCCKKTLDSHFACASIEAITVFAL